jgi:hypothetical protein
LVLSSQFEQLVVEVVEDPVQLLVAVVAVHMQALPVLLDFLLVVQHLLELVLEELMEALMLQAVPVQILGSTHQMPHQHLLPPEY